MSFELALAMGIPRTELMSRMPAREFDEWLLFMSLFPDGIGERGSYARAGAITAMIASVNRDSKKHPDAFKAEDVFPLLAEDWAADWSVDEAKNAPLPTPEETAARMRMAFAGAGARVIDLRARE